MPAITIYIDPPITGVLGKLYYVVNEVYYYAIDLPRSEEGIIDAGVGVTQPELTYVVVFPQQTVEGVTYKKTESERFNLLFDVVLDVTLTPIIQPPPVKPVTGILVAAQLALGLVFVAYKKLMKF